MFDLVSKVRSALYTIKPQIVICALAASFLVQPVLAAPDCEILDQSSKKLRTVITNDESVDKVDPTDSRSDVVLEYPSAYLKWPRYAEVTRDTAEVFAFKLDGKTPLMPVEPRQSTFSQPSMTLMVDDRYDMHFVVPIALRYALNLPRAPYMPQLDLESSEFDGLLEITNARRPIKQDERDFIFKNGGEITDFITCQKRGSVPSPNCKYRFDLEDVNVDIRFALPQLRRWKEIKAISIKFLQCVLM